MKLSSIKKTVADGAGITGQTLIYDSAVSTGSNTFLPVGLYGDSIEGTYAFTTNQDKLYLHTGQGWFNVAIVNTNPSFTTSPAGTYELATDATAYLNGTATTITLAATDPEGMPITWGYSANTAMNNIAHISNDSSVYTIEPKTQDSAGSASMPTGTLTFTASDGINIASAASTFTLTFDTTVANSEGTTLLLRGVGDAGINSTIVDNNGTGNSRTINNVGSSQQGTFSPYNSAGYSLYVNAANDYVRTTNNGNASNLGGTGNFTVEAWVYRTADPGNAHHDIIMSTRSGSTMNSGGWDLYLDDDTDGFAGFQWNQPSAGSIQLGTVNNNRWHHIAACKVSGTTTLYVDGVAVGTGSPGNLNETGKVTVGGFSDGNYRFNGYICDARVVAGTAVYTANFTPPTEPLTAISGTTFLLGAKAMMRDSSSNNHAMTLNGTPEMIPFTPYKHHVYDVSKHGGSIHAYANSGIRISDHNDFALTNENFTIEWWMYVNEFGGSANVVTTHGWASSGDFCPWAFTFYLGGGGTQKTLQIYASSAGREPNTGGAWDIYSAFSPTGISYVMTEKVWYHCAYVRNGNNIYFYVNGVQVATGSYSGTIVDNEDGDISFGVSSDGGEGSSDIVFADYRMVIGTAVYTGAFTPPSGPLTTTGGTYPSNTNVNTSITAAHTKLLFKGVDGKIIDGSSRYNLKLIGNVQSDTGVQKYSIPSILFDGTGDGLTIVNNYLGLGSNFTLETWIYPTATGSDAVGDVIFMSRDGSNNGVWLSIDSSNHINAKIKYTGSWTFQLDGTVAISLNAWHHVAMIRINGIVNVYVDGSLYSSGSDNTDITSYTQYDIGHQNSGREFNGNISDLRLTDGISRYPFIPLRETLTTTTSFQEGVTTTASNVKLLAAHTSTLATNGGNSGTAIAVQAGASASAFAPTGGMRSGYFDGGAASMLVHTDAIIGAGVFTIECWAYITKTSGYDPLFGIVPFADRNNTSSYRLFYVGSNNNLSWWNTSDFVTSPNNSVPNNEWHHLAVTRESDNKIRLYINGGNAGTSSNTYTEDLSTYTRVYIGRHNTVFYQGYISNARITNQVLYTKDFTVPSAALKG